MTVLVFGQRYVPPPPPNMLEGWERYGLIWRGWDGSVWDLRDIGSGVFVTTEGILGLDDPEFTAEAYESPAKSGRWRTDYRVPQRPFVLPVYIYSDDGSVEWQQLFRAFRHSFHPLRPGYLELQTALGRRTIELYADGTGGFSYTRDPIFEGHSRYQLQLTAEDPFWKGDVWTRTFQQIDPAPFFGVDGNLHVASSATLATAEVENDGDEDAWLQLVLVAGVTDISASIEIAGGELGPPELPAGATLVIDTDPAVGAAVLNGVDVDDQVDPWDPRPVPANAVTPLSVELDGYGELTVQLQPRYWRAL